MGECSLICYHRWNPCPPTLAVISLVSCTQWWPTTPALSAKFSTCVPFLVASVSKWKVHRKVKVNNAFSVRAWKEESSVYPFLVHSRVSLTVTLYAAMGHWVGAEVLFTVVQTVSEAVRRTYKEECNLPVWKKNQMATGWEVIQGSRLTLYIGASVFSFSCSSTAL